MLITTVMVLKLPNGLKTRRWKDKTLRSSQFAKILTIQWLEISQTSHLASDR